VSLYWLIMLLGFSLGCVVGMVMCLALKVTVTREDDDEPEPDPTLLRVSRLFAALRERDEVDPVPTEHAAEARAVHWFVSNDPEQKESFRKYRES
jgi:hypothetical protein